MLHDQLFPSINFLGVPELMEQPSIPIQENVPSWDKNRLGTHPCCHFYQHDSRFSRIMSNPNILPKGILYPFEINATIYPNYPLALVFYQLYTKRWISRYWQEQGRKVIVDLSIPIEHLELAYLGVPRTQNDFCIKLFKDDAPFLDNYLFALSQYTDRVSVNLYIFSGKWIHSHVKTVQQYRNINPLYFDSNYYIN